MISQHKYHMIFSILDYCELFSTLFWCRFCWNLMSTQLVYCSITFWEKKRDPPQSFVVDFLVKTFLLKIMQSTFKFQHPIALKLGSVCVHILTGQAKIQHLGLHHCQILNSSNRKKSIPYVRSKKLILSKPEWRKKSFCLFGIFYYL